MEPLAMAGYTAKTLSTLLIDECNNLYGKQTRRRCDGLCRTNQKTFADEYAFRSPVKQGRLRQNDVSFLLKRGKAHYMRRYDLVQSRRNICDKPLVASLDFVESDVPPIAKIEGVDLVTEGVITVNKVLEYAKDYLGDNKEYEQWSIKNDGASQICRLLFEEATDINFFVGRAVNPAHQNPDLPINFNIKMNLVRGSFKVPETNGKKNKGQLFLRR